MRGFTFLNSSESYPIEEISPNVYEYYDPSVNLRVIFGYDKGWFSNDNDRVFQMTDNYIGEPVDKLNVRYLYPREIFFSFYFRLYS